MTPSINITSPGGTTPDTFVGPPTPTTPQPSQNKRPVAYESRGKNSIDSVVEQSSEDVRPSKESHSAFKVQDVHTISEKDIKVLHMKDDTQSTHSKDDSDMEEAYTGMAL